MSFCSGYARPERRLSEHIRIFHSLKFPKEEMICLTMV
nr:MAG TPA: hypothetical protein [Caudoviricetes sp.]DAQ46852.1 MAG TPA: hypothetical protein [Caudoviricetes sp.]DAR21802.1 MAG TPA: hypothetical protein [Caudoviricetes sp.]